MSARSQAREEARPSCAQGQHGFAQPVHRTEAGVAQGVLPHVKNIMPINPSMFRAYDIRGVYGVDFDDAAAERVGAAVVAHTGAQSVIVGRDMRVSSPALAAAVVRGITAAGSDVVDIGLCSTPMFNVTVVFDPAKSAGVMVSASHNPAKYNGFKMDYPGALPISAATGMEELKRLVVEGVVHGVQRQAGTVHQLDALPTYLQRITALVDPATLTPLRMVVDCGNGIGGLTMPHLAPRIPGTVIPLYWELDGTFPHHEPDPIKQENVRDCIAAVRAEGADIGFAFDGDADRLGVVDDRGVLVRGDLLTVLLAREVLRKHPGATILYDLRASRVVPEEIAKAGGVPVPTRVGHAFIKKHFRDVGAVFAGELSNHFYFGDFAGVEATEYAMFLFLKILSVSGRKFSELVAPLERYYHSPETNFSVSDTHAVLAALEERFAPHARAISRLDGISFDMGSWWFNIRPSNTEPLLRLVVETPTQRETEERVEEIGAIIAG